MYFHDLKMSRVDSVHSPCTAARLPVSALVCCEAGCTETGEERIKRDSYYEKYVEASGQADIPMVFLLGGARGNLSYSGACQFGAYYFPHTRMRWHDTLHTLSYSTKPAMLNHASASNDKYGHGT